MSTWIFSPIFDSYALVWGAAAAMIALWLWGSFQVRTTPRRRWILGGLRLTIVILMLLALLRPTFISKELRPQRATLVVLVDHSKSMLVSDAFGGQTRWDAVAKALQSAWPAIRTLQDKFEVKLYSFDADLQPVNFAPEGPKWAGPADGQQSAIGFAIREALERESGKQIAGVVLLSDGAQQSQAPRDLAPQTATRQLASQGTPLFTVVFGQARSAGQSRDVALVDSTADATVYVKNQWTATGTVRIDGGVNQEVPVTLEWEEPAGSGKMATVGTTRIRAERDGDLKPIEFVHLPQNDGEYKVTLRAGELPGELVKTNNALSTFVTVLKGGLNVLYLEGELRVEQRYLRRALDSSPNIHVDYEWLDQRRKKAEDLSDRFKRGAYDVYILGDLDSSALRKEDLTALRDSVDAGAGLLTLGGFQAYWQGGYDETPLAAVLPLQAPPDHRGRQNLGQPIRTDLHWPGPLHMQPASPFGVQSPLMQLAALGDLNAAVWAKLPPLDGANKFDALLPSAHVLAETPDHKPLLVTREVGSGRVLSFAGDSTWHWAVKGFDKEYKRFWRQAIFWLARKTPDDVVYVELDRRRFLPGSRVEFTAGAKAADGAPLAAAAFTAEVTQPDGTKRRIPLGRKGDEATGAFLETAQAGDYTITVTATNQGAPLGQAKARFLVYEQDLELTNAAARPDLLASLAALTKDAGGKAVTPEQLPQVLEDIGRKPQQSVVEREEKYTPWDSGPFLLLLVGLLSGEWYLRKKWGLV